jgi:hypothetical protein
MIFIGCALPLVCWALMVGNARSQWGAGVVLALGGIAGIALGLRWVGVEVRITLLVVLAVLAAAVLVRGIAVEARRSGTRATWRGMVGMVLSALYSAVALLGAGMVALVGAIDGPTVVPPGSDVLPLPAGLVVTADEDQGCSGGSQTYCSRQIDIRSTTGLSDAELARLVRENLAHAHGWSLTADPGGGDSDCRDEGWLLDRQYVCVSVGGSQGRFSVQLVAGKSYH